MSTTPSRPDDASTGERDTPRAAAERYALTHTGTDGDVAFYRRQCEDARRVLELGCGAGRVTSSLTAPDRLVVGLDLDTSLLALAREEARTRVGAEPRAAFVRGDMRRFAFGTRFDCIAIPHSGLYALLSEDDCEACLRAVAGQLAPGGRLVFDTYAADSFHEDAELAHVESDEPEYVTHIEHAGRTLAVYERCRWDREAQRLDVHYEYVPVAGGPSLHATVPQRYWLHPQVEPLLARCGLTVESLSADFEGSAFGDEDEALVVVARRADA